MNCAYQAFEDAVKHLDQTNYWKVMEMFHTTKNQTHETPLEYTFAGVVPYMYTKMIQVHNSLSRNTKLSMVIEWNYVWWEEMKLEANNVQFATMEHFTAYTGVDVEKISLRPAIYFMLNEQHAMFSETIPNWIGARIIGAVQIKIFTGEFK